MKTSTLICWISMSSILCSSCASTQTPVVPSYPKAGITVMAVGNGSTVIANRNKVCNGKRLNIIAVGDGAYVNASDQSVGE